MLAHAHWLHAREEEEAMVGGQSYSSEDGGERGLTASSKRASNKEREAAVTGSVCGQRGVLRK